ncbi:MAG: universal stress protein [Candidatus Rokubacteria bacterium]|nr:universal stress protein [Candidatus Rokubacteria bacterium]
MAKRILLPLDQSLTAEAVVPLVADAARGGGGAVRLLHVAPIPQALVNKEGRVVAFVDQEFERLETEGLDYLRTIEAKLDGLPVECVVRFGDPLEEILREAEAFGADLIAVTTSGRSGISRVALGSVAEQVFRKAPVAVLLFHPPHWGVA